MLSVDTNFWYLNLCHNLGTINTYKLSGIYLVLNSYFYVLFTGCRIRRYLRPSPRRSRSIPYPIRCGSPLNARPAYPWHTTRRPYLLHATPRDTTTGAQATEIATSVKLRKDKIGSVRKSRTNLRTPSGL